MSKKKKLRGLVLLSGGFDSAVAARLAQESGAELAVVHFSQEAFVGKQAVEKTQKLARLLGIKTLFVVDIIPILKAFSQNCEMHYYFVFLKRLFFRIAERIAEENSIQFLVTGENLGQVSSQTLSNISTIASATFLPVARPLLGMDKNEIIHLSKQFGFHDTSVGPELCDYLGPKKPATVSSVSRLEEEEKKIELEKLVEEAVRTMKTKKMP